MRCEIMGQEISMSTLTRREALRITGLGVVAVAASPTAALDPVSGQAAYNGIVDEGASLAVVTARLRIEIRSITEAEWYIARDGDVLS